ncbi:MAG: DUF3796 domain-containing protein [Oscillochloris sp.]|nr:DUF3796 domain-containing protein [Oscillochloris sp.]
MPYMQWLRVIDRIPRIASMLGLFGLLGLLGFIQAEYFSYSALSFLSYLCFFRFFRRLLDPNYGPREGDMVRLLPVLVIAALGPWFIAISPLLGFLGFFGWVGLLEQPYRKLPDA